MARGIAIDLIDGLTSDAAVKGPCRALASTNITLRGLQTVGGVVLAANDRVLVAGQTTSSQNGIWVASTGDWRRSADFSRNNDVVKGTTVRVTDGSNPGFYVVTTSNPIVFDTSAISFTIDDALGYAPTTSPIFTGNPQAPTASPGDSDASIATTAFVAAAIASAIAGLINSAPGALDTLNELAAALGNDASFSATMTAALATTLKNNAAAQTLTGGTRVTSKPLGTITTGTVTPDPGDRPVQDYTNNGAHTLAPGANQGHYMLHITNGASAGAITISGWTKVNGAFNTTNANKFICSCVVGPIGSLLTIQPLQ